MRVAMVLAVLGASPAMAQEFGRIDTVSGPAVLTRVGAGDMLLTVGGQQFLQEGMPYASFVQTFGDVVLVSYSGGGTACPALFAWLDPRPGIIRQTELFGTCADGPEVSYTSEAVVVTLSSMVPGDPKSAFLWDGKTLAVTEQQLALAPTGLPPGGPAEAWVGHWPGDLLGAAEWQGTLQALLGAAALADLQRLVSGPGYPFEMQGDWVVAQACQAHNCGDTGAVVALRRADGALLVALWEKGLGTRVFGDTSRGVPAGVTELMAKR